MRTALHFALSACIVLVVGCASPQRLRARYPLTAETLACVRACGLLGRSLRGEQRRPPTRGQQECVAICPGLAREEGTCDGLLAPCVELRDRGSAVPALLVTLGALGLVGLTVLFVAAISFRPEG